MTKQKFSFVKSVTVLFKRVFSGQVHFSKQYSGKILSMDDGKIFKIFRDLWVSPKQDNANSVAVFVVRFKFSSLPLAVNKRLSMMPAPFLIAKPGFREKIWAVSSDGYFLGMYQWASTEYAEDYPNSFILKLMIKRASEGSLNFRVLPNECLSDYIESRQLREQ